MTKNLATPRLILRSPSLEDLFALSCFEKRNTNHLAKWESTTTSNLQPIQNRLENWIEECKKGVSARFFMRIKENSDLIIGCCNFTQIFHGSFQACYLGYKIDHEYEGKGIMFEALETSIRYAFEELNLHRIMANYMPANIKSAKLLDRLGFTIEGYAKNYLLINGQWEDHILTSLTIEEWKLSQSLKNQANTKEGSLVFRKACLKDLEAIINLLFEDSLGQNRELRSNPPLDSYLESFSKICSSPNDELIVAELNDQVIGLMQITYLQHLTFQGSRVAHIEGVRIQRKHQNKGYGKQLFQWAIKRAKIHGCHRVQLTTDKSRGKAKHFYEQLGFSATHEGMKLYLKGL